MEIHFTSEEEAQLSQIAAFQGTDAEQLVKNAVLRIVEDGKRFREGVRRGIAQADRGELMDHEEVIAQFERKFGS